MLSHVVRDYIDILHIQRMTKIFAATLGFNGRECSELAIVASELASNILKYGVSGSIELLAITEASGVGVSLIAHDTGPPFRDLKQATQDGWDDSGPIDPLLILNRKGIGGGLGAVARLTDNMRVEPEPGGKRVVAVRYLKAKRPAPTRFD